MSTGTTTKQEALARPRYLYHHPPAAWPIVLVTVLAIALVPIFFAQAFWAMLLFTPWYLPLGGTACAIGAVCLVGRPRRWWRIALATLCVALASLEWLFLLGMTVLPAYAGPIKVGSGIPQFHAKLSDGTTIDESYFQKGRTTLLVFFQGRWCPFCMTQLKELEAHNEEFEFAGADVVVVSLEDVATAAETQRDFPHLRVVSDEARELSDAIDLINRGFAPGGSDCATPTMLVVDGNGAVKWLHRPERFIARPSSQDIIAIIQEQQQAKRIRY